MNVRFLSDCALIESQYVSVIYSTVDKMMTDCVKDSPEPAAVILGFILGGILARAQDKNCIVTTKGLSGLQCASTLAALPICHVYINYKLRALLMAPSQCDKLTKWRSIVRRCHLSKIIRYLTRDNALTLKVTYLQGFVKRF